MQKKQVLAARVIGAEDALRKRLSAVARHVAARLLGISRSGCALSSPECLSPRRGLGWNGGRYWTRTSDFDDVNIALYQLS